MNDRTPRLRSGNIVKPDEAWLARAVEPPIEPDLPIVDPHHHLWDRPGYPYLLPELMTDLACGHRIEATVFVECMSMYRADGPAERRPVGETEFVNGVAAMSASGDYGPARICAGIVSFADLTLGDAVAPVLEAHVQAGGGRFRGIRHAAGWDASDAVWNSHTNPIERLYGDARFRAGFARLRDHALTFDAWLYHPQLGDVISLAQAFSDTTIILDHVGGPVGIGPYAGKGQETFSAWRSSIRTLAHCPNVVVKLGGLGMKIGMFDFHRRAEPVGSEALASAFRPWIETCIDAFGTDRCMFESNFPVDKVTGSYGILWNAFKRLAAGCSASERAALFAGTARRVYRLGG